MSETDSATIVQEEAGSKPDTSQQAVVSETPTGNSLEGAELAEALRNDPAAFEIVRRELQSNKDKGIAEANKKSEQALSEVERLERLMTPENQAVFREIRKEDAINRLIEGSNLPNVSGTEQKVEAKVPASELDFIKAFKDAGIDVQDLTQEDRANITAMEHKSQTALKNEIFKTFGSKVQTTSSAGAVQPGGTSKLPTTGESLKQQKEALLADRNKMISVEGRDELKTINRKLEELNA